MIKKPELYSRFLKFMIAVYRKDSKLWVSRDKLKDYAFNEGYKSQTVWNAFERLDNNVQIGKTFDSGARYRYYDIPKGEVKILQNNIKLFDSYKK